MCFLYFHKLTSLLILVIKCVGFPLTHQKILWHPLHFTQFNLFLTLPGDSVRYHFTWTQSHKTASNLRCQSQLVGPQVIHKFCPTWLQSRVSRDLISLGFDYLLEWLIELRETLTFTRSRDTIKDTDEGIHRVRSGRGLSTRAFVHVGLGLHHSPSVDVFTHLEAF